MLFFPCPCFAAFRPVINFPQDYPLGQLILINDLYLRLIQTPCLHKSRSTPLPKILTADHLPLHRLFSKISFGNAGLIFILLEITPPNFAKRRSRYIDYRLFAQEKKEKDK